MSNERDQDSIIVAPEYLEEANRVLSENSDNIDKGINKGKALSENQLPPKTLIKKFKRQVALLLAAGSFSFLSGGDVEDNVEMSKEPFVKVFEKENFDTEKNLVPKGLSLEDLSRPVNVKKYGYGELVKENGKIYIILKKGYFVDVENNTISKK